MGGLAVAVFAGVLLVLAMTTHDITPARVTASAVFDGDAAFGPGKTLDHSTVETFTLRNYWLLPSGTPGWIRLDLAGAYRLDRVAILNTRNGLQFDRATKGYRVELIGPTGSSFLAGELPAYPEWREHDLPGPVVTAVTVHVDGHEGLGGGLDEIALTGRRAHGLGALPDTVWAALFTALIMLAAARLPAGWRRVVTRERSGLFVLSLVLVVVGVRVLRFSTSVSAMEWGLIFNVRELNTLAKVQAFFANLMVPIPPALALVEIVAQNATGNNDLMIKTIYKVSIVGGYLAALRLAYPRIERMLATFLVSLLFMVSTAVIHPGNPQIYDTVFPFLVMSFLVLVSSALEAPERGGRRGVRLGAAGLCLSLVALTRPFAIILVLAAVAFLVRRLPGPRRHRLVFVLCAGSLCLPWHAYLFVRHGQLGISNHTGYNLADSWPMVPRPPVLPEEVLPPYRGLNNPTRVMNSRRLQSAILRYAVTHPGEAIDNVIRRLAIMTEGHTVIIGERLQPRNPVLWLYRMVVRFLSLLLLLTALQRLARWASTPLRRRRPAHHSTAPPAGDALVGALRLGMTAGALAFLALGDAGEEARFMISLLPMLAVAPDLLVDPAAMGPSGR